MKRRPKPATPASRLGGRFWVLWTGSTASNLGDGVLSLVIPWTVASMTSNATLVAIVAFLSRLPWLMLSMLAGYTADLFRKSAVLLWSTGTRIGILAAFLSLGMTEHLNVIAIATIAFLLSVCELATDIAASSITPELVSKESLGRANSTLRSAEIVTNDFAGQPAGGALLALSPAAPIVATVGLAATSLACFAKLHRSEDDDPSAPRSTNNTRFLAGVTLIRRTLPLRVFLITNGLIMTAAGLIASIQVLFAKEVLFVDAFGFGLLAASGAAGGLVGAQVGGRVGMQDPFKLLATSLAILSVAFASIALVRSPLIASAIFMAGSACLSFWAVVTGTLRQLLTPIDLQGRTNGVHRMITSGLSSLGLLISGVLVTTVGLYVNRAMALGASYVLAGAIVFGVLILFVRNMGALRAFMHAQDRTDGS